ncbi:tyrosine-type recombinase/integrase [Halarsenatibacter silvermanii]|uniref:Integrase/recombinase XerD n=1 Tax=Halarsenatibacter silvermanii TaxID=321763 RepID=A0A1G9TMN8_9FIRM|nr:tyrosine-type recombinase/integrase [Halarsenatibacter silvermanii]SDM48940.1 integrase/recombinase XerD [Halarsenatibacter silvermanii]
MPKRKIPDVLSEEEQKKILGVFNERYFSSQRNKMMIKLMLDAGLRLSEAINLSWQDVNLQTGEIKIRESKNEKGRIVWLNEETLEKLKNWRRRQNEELEKEVDLVFTTKTGNQLNPRNVRSMVYNYTEKAGITNKDVSPHTFRHTFATDLYRRTKNLRLVQKALGHADISTTQIYTHIVDEEMEEAMKNFRGGERD